MIEPDAGVLSEPEELVCGSPGCDGQRASECVYVDRRHVRCGTAWCDEHGVVVEDRFYCRRHAGIIRALAHIPPAERDLPDVANRAPSLCEWMAARCDPYISQLLQSLAAHHPGSSYTVDGLRMTMTGMPRVATWEHVWRVVDHTGPLYTVALRVEEPRDTVVVARVNATVVEEAVPPWIEQQGPTSEADDQARRAAFDRRIQGAIYEKIRALLADA